MPLSPQLSHLVRTAALLESRADRYSEYLAEIFRPRGWVPALVQWGREEATHGAALQEWLAEHEPAFAFEACMQRYSALPYHAATGRPSYGSEQGELVARCVVEAMAASYYQALAASARDVPSLHRLCRRLAADEARHFSLFLRMLGALRREQGTRRGEALAVMLRRLVALNDEQIAYASFVVGGVPGHFDVRTEARRYRSVVLRVLRPRQVRFVGTLLWRVLAPPSTPRTRAIPGLAI